MADPIQEYKQLAEFMKSKGGNGDGFAAAVERDLKAGVDSAAISAGIQRTMAKYGYTSPGDKMSAPRTQAAAPATKPVDDSDDDGLILSSLKSVWNAVGEIPKGFVQQFIGTARTQGAAFGDKIAQSIEAVLPESLAKEYKAEREKFINTRTKNPLSIAMGGGSAVAQQDADAINKVLTENLQTKVNEDFQKDHPWIAGISSGIGSAVGSYLTGRGVMAIGKQAPLAVMAAVEGISSVASSYQEAKKAGYFDKEAQVISTAIGTTMGAASGLLNSGAEGLLIKTLGKEGAENATKSSIAEGLKVLAEKGVTKASLAEASQVSLTALQQTIKVAKATAAKGFAPEAAEEVLQSTGEIGIQRFADFFTGKKEGQGFNNSVEEDLKSIAMSGIIGGIVGTPFGFANAMATKTLEPTLYASLEGMASSNNPQGMADLVSKYQDVGQQMLADKSLSPKEFARIFGDATPENPGLLAQMAETAAAFAGRPESMATKFAAFDLKYNQPNIVAEMEANAAQAQQAIATLQQQPQGVSGDIAVKDAQALLEANSPKKSQRVKEFIDWAYQQTINGNPVPAYGATINSLKTLEVGDMVKLGTSERRTIKSLNPEGTATLDNDKTVALSGLMRLNDGDVVGYEKELGFEPPEVGDLSSVKKGDRVYINRGGKTLELKVEEMGANGLKLSNGLTYSGTDLDELGQNFRGKINESKRLNLVAEQNAKDERLSEISAAKKKLKLNESTAQLIEEMDDATLENFVPSVSVATKTMVDYIELLKEERGIIPLKIGANAQPVTARVAPATEASVDNTSANPASQPPAPAIPAQPATEAEAADPIPADLIELVSLIYDESETTLLDMISDLAGRDPNISAVDEILSDNMPEALTEILLNGTSPRKRVWVAQTVEWLYGARDRIQKLPRSIYSDRAASLIDEMISDIGIIEQKLVDNNGKLTKQDLEETRFHNGLSEILRQSGPGQTQGANENADVNQGTAPAAATPADTAPTSAPAATPAVQPTPAPAAPVTQTVTPEETNRKYLSAFAQVLAKRFKGIKVEFTTGKSWAGMLTGDVITLNMDKATAGTVLHELGHVYLAMAKKNYVNLYRQGIGIANSPSAKAYQDFVLQTYKDDIAAMPVNKRSEFIANEVLAVAIEDRGQRLIDTGADTKSIRQQFADWVERVFKYFDKAFKVANSQDMTIQQFADMVAADILELNEPLIVDGKAMPVVQPTPPAPVAPAPEPEPPRGTPAPPIVPALPPFVQQQADENQKSIEPWGPESERSTIESQAKADGTWLKAPNGQPSKLTPAQWVTTRTAAFKNWFGDWQNNPAQASKVVDENGEPMIMYHGTSAVSERGDSFARFDAYGVAQYGLFGQGVYFTDNAQVASEYTSKGRGSNPNVYPVFLKITNPIDMDAQGDAQAWAARFSDEISAEEIPSGSNEDMFRAVEESFRQASTPRDEAAMAIQEGMMAMGHDGVTHIGGGRVRSEGIRHRVFIAFDPEQIKSSIANTGDFDPNNPNMMKSILPWVYTSASTPDPVLTPLDSPPMPPQQVVDRANPMAPPVTVDVDQLSLNQGDVQAMIAQGPVDPAERDKYFRLGDRLIPNSVGDFSVQVEDAITDLNAGASGGGLLTSVADMVASASNSRWFGFKKANPIATLSMRNLGKYISKEGDLVYRLLVEQPRKLAAVGEQLRWLGIKLDEDLKADKEILDLQSSHSSARQNVEDWVDVVNWGDVTVDDVPTPNLSLPKDQAIDIVFSLLTQFTQTGKAALNFNIPSESSDDKAPDKRLLQFTSQEQARSFVNSAMNDPVIKRLADKWNRYVETVWPYVDETYRMDMLKNLERVNGMYFPLITSGKLLDGNEMKMSLQDFGGILGQEGILKDRDPNVEAIIEVRSVFDLMSGYQSVIADYVQYKPTITNAKMVVEKFGKTMDKNGMKHIREGIEKLAVDYANNRNRTRSWVQTFDKLYMRQIFSVPNFSTPLKQLGGYLFAMGTTDIDNKYLSEAMVTTVTPLMVNAFGLPTSFEGRGRISITGENQRNELLGRIFANKYAPAVAMRIARSAPPDLIYLMGNTASGNDFLSKVFNVADTIADKFGLDWMTRADAVQMIGLYRAAELQISEQQPNLSGEDFDKAVAELATNAMYESAPTHDITDKSHMQIFQPEGLAGQLLKSTILFTNQTFKTFSRLNEISLDYLRNPNDANKRKLIGIGFQAAVVQPLLMAAITQFVRYTVGEIGQAIGSAITGDDREEKKPTQEEWWKKFAMEYIRNLEGVMPGISGTVFQTITSMLNPDGFYENPAESFTLKNFYGIFDFFNKLYEFYFQEQYKKDGYALRKDYFNLVKLGIKTVPVVPTYGYKIAEPTLKKMLWPESQKPRKKVDPEKLKTGFELLNTKKSGGSAPIAN